MAKRPQPKAAKRRIVGGFTAAEIAAASQTQERVQSSTPKAIVEAFAPDAPEAAGITLQPIHGGTIILMTKLESSLLKTDNTAAFLLEDMFRGLVLLSVPIAEARRIVATRWAECPACGNQYEASAAGLKCAHKCAGTLVAKWDLEERVTALADVFPPTHIQRLAEILNAHIVSAFKTLVPHARKKDGQGSENFTATAAVATATAGS